MANEKRLIDANAYPCNTCDISYCYKNCDKFNAWFEKTVDAVEVVHGRWLSAYEYGLKLGITDKEKLEELKKDKWWKFCNYCEQQVKGVHNFCPHCGAKMDGDGNG